MPKPRHLSIKHFDKFQHYKHRNPPWIKLHLELLDDADFLKLPDAIKWQYVGMLLLASRHENRIFNDESYIRNRLGLMTKLDLTSRFMKERVLATRKHPASVLHTNADSEAELSRVEKSNSEKSARGASTKAPASAPRRCASPPVSEEERLKELNLSRELAGVLTSLGKSMP